MWISTVSGNYVNSDFVRKIEYDGEHTTISVMGEDVPLIIAYDEDIRDVIVSEIMEVVR